MQKALFLFLIFSVSFCCDAQTTLLFSIEQGMENETDIIAVPFVMYSGGKYLQTPSCEIGAAGTKEKAECAKAKRELQPLVQKGKTLFLLIEGKQSGSTSITEAVEFAVTDWSTYSGKLDGTVNAKLLTNNASLGLKPLKPIKTLPILKARKDPEGMLLKNELIGKLDMDGDGFAELVYQCADYEGHFYEIYSYKNGRWTKVYSGGYQGA